MQTAIKILRIPADGIVEHDRRRYWVVEHTTHYTEIAVEKRRPPKRICQQPNMDKTGETK